MQLHKKPIYVAILLLSSHLASGKELNKSIDTEKQQTAEVIILPRVEIIGNQQELFRTPSSANIISQQTLESNHVFTTNEALRKVPGVVVRDEEGFGMRPNIGIRGLNPTRSTKVLLLEDGIPLMYAPYGDNSSYYFPAIDRFSSIEVLKGASQVKYGPQTIGGVINFITPNAPEKFGGFARFSVGNQDFLGTKINVGGNGMLFDYTHKEGDGARDNTHSNLEDVNFKITKAITDNHAITLRANYADEDSQVSYAGLTREEFNNFGGRYNPFNHDSFQTTRYGLSATHDWQINNNAFLTTNYYYSYFDRDWWRQQSTTATSSIASGTGCAVFAAARLAGTRTDGDTCQGNQGRLRTYYTYGVEPRLNVKHSLGEFDAGLRLHLEEQDRRQRNGTSPTARSGALIENNERNTHAYSGFISNRFDINQFFITPVVRYEYIENERKNKLNGANGKATIQEWIPGVSMGYTPNDALTVFAGVHEGFAPPRVEDLINNTTGGSVEINPEKSTNFELGFRSKPSKNSRIEATFFHNKFDNLIAVGSIAGNVPLSQGKAIFTGLEFLGSYDFENGFYSSLALTWLPVAEQDAPFINVLTNAIVNNSKNGNRQPYAPKLSATLGVGYKMNNWDLMLEAVHVGNQFGDFAETKAVSVDGSIGEIASYTIMNASVNYKLPQYATTLFLTGKNIFDKDYIVDRTRGILVGMPALIQVGARYDF